MSEIDKLQQAIDHAVTQGDQGINGTERKTVNELLEKFVHPIN
jgi:hypothetical protein